LVVRVTFTGVLLLRYVLAEANRVLADLDAHGKYLGDIDGHTENIGLHQVNEFLGGNDAVGGDLWLVGRNPSVGKRADRKP
jgi:hypothetical protein